MVGTHLLPYICLTLLLLKPRPNERNMTTQHIVTLLGTTCCVRLATLLQHVATCSVLLAQIYDHFQTWANNPQHVETYRNMVAKRTRHACCAQQCCDISRWHVAIVWPGLKLHCLRNIRTFTTEIARDDITIILHNFFYRWCPYVHRQDPCANISPPNFISSLHCGSQKTFRNDHFDA